ncbi:MAG: hypothetical protein EAX95_03260 [Candidatus Thorarchaeota archaeon]|nr:hypothetical protein [Candidatus Thorarchaeota archaeon]
MTKAVQMSNGLGKTPCGRCGCIIVYTGDYCFFCDAAKEMLGEAIAQYGVSDSAICQIDVDSEGECGCNDSITRLPTIRICSVKLEGLPDEGQVTDAVLRALMMDCFCESPGY